MVPIRSKDSIQSTGKERWVILVHGVLRSAASMSKIQAVLRENGYHTHCFEYNSRKETIKSIDHRLHKDVSNIAKRNVETISFVTHSFGTLVVRYYLANHELKKGGRFVMIAPCKLN